MSDKKVLIFYGTRYGATEGVAGRMAEIIREKGNRVEVINLKDLPHDRVPEFSNYDGILIGSGIKIGQWTKDVKKFVGEWVKELNNFKGKLGFYVCSGYASNLETYEKVKSEYTVEACEKLGLRKLDLYDAFGGLMDFTETSRMGWLEKRILKMAAQQTTGQKAEDGSYNDLRNWNQIEKFTLDFIRKL